MNDKWIKTTLLVLPLTWVGQSAFAECPNHLPTKLLEDCIVVEGAGDEYPVEQKLAEWMRLHPAEIQPAAGAGNGERKEETGNSPKE